MAAVDVLESSVCVALAEEENFVSLGSSEGEAALEGLDMQRHFTRRDTFDPYREDAALRSVPSSYQPPPSPVRALTACLPAPARTPSLLRHQLMEG